MNKKMPNRTEPYRDARRTSTDTNAVHVVRRSSFLGRARDVPAFAQRESQQTAKRIPIGIPQTKTNPRIKNGSDQPASQPASQPATPTDDTTRATTNKNLASRTPVKVQQAYENKNSARYVPVGGFQWMLKMKKVSRTSAARALGLRQAGHHVKNLIVWM